MKFNHKELTKTYRTQKNYALWQVMNLFQKLQLARNIYIKIIQCYHATRRHVINLWKRNHNHTFELISSQKIKKCGAVDFKIKWILSTALIIIYVSNFYAYLYGACEIYRIYNCLIKEIVSRSHTWWVCQFISVVKGVPVGLEIHNKHFSL